jgi:hypothetical protein
MVILRGLLPTSTLLANSKMPRVVVSYTTKVREAEGILW